MKIDSNKGKATKFHERFKGRISLISKQGTFVAQSSVVINKKWFKSLFDHYNIQSWNRTNNISSEDTPTCEIKNSKLIKYNNILTKSLSNAKINRRHISLLNSFEDNKCEDVCEKSKIGLYWSQKVVDKKCKSRAANVQAKFQYKDEELKLPMLPKGRSIKSVISHYNSYDNSYISSKRKKLRDLLEPMIERNGPNQVQKVFKDKMKSLYIRNRENIKKKMM